MSIIMPATNRDEETLFTAVVSFDIMVAVGLRGTSRQPAWSSKSAKVALPVAGRQLFWAVGAWAGRC